MENQNILNLLNEVSDPRFVRSKWNIVGDQWVEYFDLRTVIICNKEVLKANLI